MSHSLSSMQSMLDICSIEIAILQKSVPVTFYIGARYNFDCAPLILDGSVLSVVAVVRYLGIRFPHIKMR